MILQELGDVREWAVAIENDLDSVSSSLEFIMNSANIQQVSGSSDGTQRIKK